jgi:hypothetical protein
VVHLICLHNIIGVQVVDSLCLIFLPRIGVVDNGALGHVVGM